jgi:hypothetical protein
MEKKLIELGWICNKCSCPHGKGWDCMHKDFKGVLIKVRLNFRIFKNNLVIDSGFGYQLEQKLKNNGIFKEDIQA